MTGPARRRGGAFSMPLRGGVHLRTGTLNPIAGKGDREHVKEADRSLCMPMEGEPGRTKKSVGDRGGTGEEVVLVSEQKRALTPRRGTDRAPMPADGREQNASGDDLSGRRMNISSPQGPEERSLERRPWRSLLTPSLGAWRLRRKGKRKSGESRRTKHKRNI